MTWGVPIAGIAVFVVLLLIVQMKDLPILLLPLIFGIVSPIVVAKDLVNYKIFKKQGNSMLLTKKFGKPMAMDLSDIIDVTVYEDKNRTVVLLLTKDQKKIIALGDWFPQEGIKQLIKELESDSKEHGFEVSKFDNKMVVQQHVGALYKK
jgi:hypothetical protein